MDREASYISEVETYGKPLPSKLGDTLIVTTKGLAGKTLQHSSEEDTSLIMAQAARVLKSICSTQTTTGTLPSPKQEALLLFQGTTRSNVNIDFYCRRLALYTKCSTTALVGSLIYIDRLILEQHSRDQSFALSFDNVHRLLLAALVISMKYWDCDQLYPNSYYARVGGILPEELLQLESEFLFVVGFNLDISVEAFNEYMKHLNTPSVNLHEKDEMQATPSEMAHHDVLPQIDCTPEQMNEQPQSQPNQQQNNKHFHQDEGNSSIVFHFAPKTHTNIPTPLKPEPTSTSIPIPSPPDSFDGQFEIPETSKLGVSPDSFDSQFETPETPKLNESRRVRRSCSSGGADGPFPALDLPEATLTRSYSASSPLKRKRVG